jgi:hypothetical protein
MAKNANEVVSELNLMLIDHGYPPARLSVELLSDSEDGPAIQFRVIDVVNGGLYGEFTIPLAQDR